MLANPGRKRSRTRRGNFHKDIIALHDEKIEGEPLLVKVMEKNKITCSLPSLEKISAFVRENLSKLPEKYKRLHGGSLLSSRRESQTQENDGRIVSRT